MKTKVLARIVKAKPDITEYQKYGIELEFDNLYAEIVVDGVIDKDGRVVAQEAEVARAMTRFAKTLLTTHLQTIQTIKEK